MNYQGVLTKMKTELGTPIQYYLVFKNDFLNVNQLLDKKVKISFIVRYVTILPHKNRIIKNTLRPKNI